jgi:hypothetical protein
VSPPRAPEDGGPPPERPLSWGERLWILLVFLTGPAYLLWMTGVEGRRIWVVGGIVLLIAACAALAHRLMAMTRR